MLMVCWNARNEALRVCLLLALAALTLYFLTKTAWMAVIEKCFDGERYTAGKQYIHVPLFIY